MTLEIDLFWARWCTVIIPFIHKLAAMPVWQCIRTLVPRGFATRRST